MKILLVYPSGPESFWSFRHVLPFVRKKAAFPPLGLLTVAAMLPAAWDLRLVDLNVRPLAERDIAWADFVFLSGMIVHKASAHEVALRCSALGRTVIAGGPLFTTGHTEFPEIGHFVLGEAEDVVHELVADMERGALKAEYRSRQFPDVRKTPVPRWDLVDVHEYVTMPVQFSRGCPFNCEFCDIVVMNGRVPRTKEPAQVLRELDALRRRGWSQMVFLVDDNFIGNRKRARELLKELVSWRLRTGTDMGFLTEASVNLADDAELCSLMVQAGFKKVFLGLETPSAAGLEECRKVQNRERDLCSTVACLQAAGMEVMGGFIVGFDSDPHDIFRRQFEFIQESGVVTAMVGMLTALPQTELYRRLTREGRILMRSAGNNTDAVINFVTRLDRNYLVEGYRELMRKLYEPANYYRRIRIFLERYRVRGPSPSLCLADFSAFLKSLWVLGVRRSGRFQYWRLVLGTLFRSPRKFRVAMELAILGFHFRRVANEL